MLKINLQPRVVIEIKEGIQLQWWIPIALGIVIAVATASIYLNLNTRMITQKAEIKQLQFDLKDFQQILDDFEEANNEKKYLTGKREFVKGVSENQRMWLAFFDALTTNIPTDVWINRMDASRIGEFSFEGNAYTYSAIGFFMLQLYSIDYITAVNLEGATGAGGAQTGETTAEALSKRFRVTGKMDLTPTKKENES
ncbi:MAG: PilN domain-containing protein [bacterium]